MSGFDHLIPLTDEFFEDLPRIEDYINAALRQAMDAEMAALFEQTRPVSGVDWLPAQPSRRVLVAAASLQRAVYWAERCMGWTPRQYQFCYDVRVAYGYDGPLFVVEPLGSDNRADTWREFAEVMEARGAEVNYFVQ